MGRSKTRLDERMKLRPETYVQNGSVAVSAARREQIVIVGLAVRLSVAFEKVDRSQLLAAVHAHKVFRMPRPAQSRDDLPSKKRNVSMAAGDAMEPVN